MWENYSVQNTKSTSLGTTLMHISYAMFAKTFNKNSVFKKNMIVLYNLYNGRKREQAEAYPRCFIL